MACVGHKFSFDSVMLYFLKFILFIYFFSPSRPFRELMFKRIQDQIEQKSLYKKTKQNKTPQKNPTLNQAI